VYRRVESSRRLTRAVGRQEIGTDNMVKNNREKRGGVVWSGSGEASLGNRLLVNWYFEVIS
jgi:hypothetical protein